jgi:hypothetical protein
VDERVQMAGVGFHNLKHAGLFDAGGAPPLSSVKVTDLTGAVVYARGVDYNVNYINGQVQRIAGFGIADGQIVLVTYQYQVTEQELKFEGRNFWNFINDVDIQGGKITVINDWSIVFTTQFDPAQAYAVNDTLNAGTTAAGLDGLVTKGGAGAYIGKVFQVPTADDPFLGIRYVGGMVS